MASKGINPVLQAKGYLNQLFKAVADNNVKRQDDKGDITVGPLIEAGQKNTASIAARFLIAEQARSFWNKQYDAVKAEAKKAGILGEEDDYVTGESVVVSSFSGFDITAKKASASEMADTTATKNVINKYVPAAKREAALEECIKERKGAVTISVSVK